MVALLAGEALEVVDVGPGPHHHLEGRDHLVARRAVARRAEQSGRGNDITGLATSAFCGGGVKESFPDDCAKFAESGATKIEERRQILERVGISVPNIIPRFRPRRTFPFLLPPCRYQS